MDGNVIFNFVRYRNLKTASPLQEESGFFFDQTKNMQREYDNISFTKIRQTE